MACLNLLSQAASENRAKSPHHPAVLKVLYFLQSRCAWEKTRGYFSLESFSTDAPAEEFAQTAYNRDAHKYTVGGHDVCVHERLAIMNSERDLRPQVSKHPPVQGSTS